MRMHASHMPLSAEPNYKSIGSFSSEEGKNIPQNNLPKKESPVLLNITSPYTIL